MFLYLETTEKIIPHIQNLQNELEGTKGCINKLERKVSKIGQDICAIDRNLREILKHITNVSKMGPLEPLQPLTPVTPLNSLRSNFDFSEMTLNDPPALSETFSDRDADSVYSTLLLDGAHSPDRVTPVTTTPASSLQFRTPNFTAPIHYDRSKRRSSLQVPLLLNPHDLVTRRYSDGTEKNEHSLLGGIIASKSEHDFKQNSNIGNKSGRDFVKHKFTAPSKSCKTTVGSPLEPGIEFSENHGLVESDSYELFMNSLEDIHSTDCKSPLLIRKHSSHNSRNKLHKSFESDTCNSSIPSVNIDFHADETPPTSTGVSLKDITNNVKKPSTPRSLVASRSCFEIRQRQKKLPPKQQSFVKTRSQIFLETEFGAKTPNEVRTVFSDKNPLNHSDGHSLSQGTMVNNMIGGCIEITDSDCDTNASGLIKCGNHIRNNSEHNACDPYSAVRCKDVNSKCSIDQPYDTCKPDTSPSICKTDQAVDTCKTDSGNVSLLDAIDCKENCNETISGYSEFGEQRRIEGPETNHKRLCNSTSYSHKLKSDSVSPDSPTDISESLKTEDDISCSRFVEDTIVDIDSDHVETDDLFTQILDNSTLRSTNL